MPILVTGASGNVGRHVVEQLVAAGEQVRAVSRSRATRFPKGVEVFQADLARPDTLVPAFDGVERMYLFPLAYLAPVVRTFSDAIDATPVVELAGKAGVRRAVMLGSSDPGFEGVEKAVAEMIPEWTILHPGEFAVNKLDWWAPSIKADGVVRAAYIDAKGTPIHEADIADVAVAALLEGGHAGKHYDLTGPQALTLREQAQAIATGAGRDIRFEELTHEQARAELIEQGVAAEIVDELILWYPENYAELEPEVHPSERITGRPSRTLAQWAADHADAFR